MTLSIGDLVRKYKRDGSGPTEGESHVLFEVVELTSYEYDVETKMQQQTVKLKVRE